MILVVLVVYTTLLFYRYSIGVIASRPIAVMWLMTDTILRNIGCNF